jgi:hypothetical protein
MRSDIPSKELSRSENLASSIVIVRTRRDSFCLHHLHTLPEDEGTISPNRRFRPEVGHRLGVVGQAVDLDSYTHSHVRLSCPESHFGSPN